MRTLAGLFAVVLFLSGAEILASFVLVVRMTNRFQARKGLQPMGLSEVLRAFPLSMEVGLPVVFLSINLGVATMLAFAEHSRPLSAAILPAMLGGVFTGVMLIILGALSARSRSH